MSESDRIQAAFASTLEGLQDALRERFGIAHLEVAGHVEDGRVVVHGEVLTETAIHSLVGALRRGLPSDVGIDVERVRARITDEWRRVPTGGLDVWRAVPGTGPAERVTQLRPEDGPVECLLQLEDGHCIRGIDGTVGWIDARLEIPSPAPSFELPRLAEGSTLVESARSFLGVPYLLGGTTATGIDCSGLVQRALRQSGGPVLPRHSRDQLAVDPHEGGDDLNPGDLVFVWTDEEARGHVGLATGRGQIVHASRSRGEVVEVPASDLVGSASRVMSVPFASLLELGRRLAGAARLTDRFALGRPVGQHG